MKFWKFLVYALMIYVFIAGLISNQSLATCLCAPAMIYGVYYLIKKCRNKKPPVGSDAAALREIADTPGAKEAAKAREKASLDAEIAGAVQKVLSGAGQAAKDGRRKYDYLFDRRLESRVRNGVVRELRKRGFSAYCQTGDDCCLITVKW